MPEILQVSSNSALINMDRLSPKPLFQLDNSKDHVRTSIRVSSAYENGSPDSPDLAGQQPKRRSWIARWKDDLVRDLRSANWTKITLSYLLGVWTLSLFVLCTTFPLYLYTRGMNTDVWSWWRYDGEGAGCLPNDVFDAREGRFNVFDAAGFFQITHGFGQLTFTQAKLIDVTWDIIIGRVGQSILAYFSWKAFSAHFKHEMKTEPISYSLYWNVFVNDQPSFLSAWKTTTEAFKHHTRGRSKSSMVFVILSMIFILVFPTFVSAMTGYRPNTAAFVLNDDGNLVPFEKFAKAQYIIYDGSRVGLQNGSVISCVDDDNVRCPILRDVYEYTEQYSFFGLDNKTGEPLEWPTDFMDYQLNPPILNISAFYLPWNKHGHNWVDPRTKTRPFANESNIILHQIDTPNKTYTYDYIQDHGSCIQQTTYQWGFSFLQVFVMGILLLIWTCGTFTMWIEAHNRLKRATDDDVPVKYKAAYILSTSLNLQIIPLGINPLAVSSQQLEHIVKKDLTGGRIMTGEEDMDVDDGRASSSIWRASRGYMKKHPVWSLWLLFLTGYIAWVPLTFYSVMLLWVYCHPVVMAAHLGTVLAVSVASTKKNKGLFVFLGFVGGFAVWGLILGITTSPSYRF